MGHPSPGLFASVPTENFADFDQQTPGDILVFLSGREEIDRCLELLAELLPT